MATRTNNTMAEGLQNMLGDVGAMKALPDADIQFLMQLETLILGKLRAPVESMAGQVNGMGGNDPAMMGAGGPGGPPMGPPPGMGGPPPIPMGAPGGPPTGMMMGAGQPNPDELRRLLSGVAGG